MPRSRRQESSLITVSEALNLLTVDQLKQRVALLVTSERPARKAELVSLIERCLQGEQLRALWDQLNELQKKAVSETLYSTDALFNEDRFEAKYGTLPDFGTRNRGYKVTPSLLALFIYSNHRYNGTASSVPEELAQRLRHFVPEPAEPTLDGIEDVPDTSEQQVSLTRCDTERAAQQDIHTILRMVDRGKVTVSNKTFQASAATVKAVTAVLRDGDFFVLEPKQHQWEQEIGAIKAFAWPLLVQAAKLAELHGNKLALTTAGRKALSEPQPKTLRTIWQRWLKTRLYDEFNRVDAIKGQRGRGKRAMTTAPDRRADIAAALEQCPIGQWVSFDAFSRFMQAAGFDFIVTRDPWTLYIADAHYGSLGYAGFHAWHLLQGRYALCLLLEYAATLGLIDVAYVDPRGARPDYGDLWGVDELEFLSRYDGLMYFRVNPLGAFCLGLTPKYVPSQQEARTTFSVLPSLRIRVTDGALPPDETLLLETYAEHESDGVWRLDRDKTLCAIESGHHITELRDFLAAHDAQPLPETVESFIVKTDRHARALVNTGTALLIECADAAVAELMAQHEQTKPLCMRAGERCLVVPIEAEEQFRKALHVLGYGMPRA